MNSVTNSWGFSSQEQMETWLTKFETAAQAVFDKYDVPNLLKALKFDRGEQKFSIKIAALPPTGDNTNEEKALDEVVQIFNSGSFLN